MEKTSPINRVASEHDCGMHQTGFHKALKPANKKAAAALENRNHRVWGLGGVPFVVTAKGAKRIGYLVGAHTGRDAAEVVKEVQAKSKDAAKSWVAV